MAKRQSTESASGQFVVEVWYTLYQSWFTLGHLLSREPGSATKSDHQRLRNIIHACLSTNRTFSSAMTGGPRLRQKNATAGSSNTPHYDQEDEHVSSLYHNPVCSLMVGWFSTDLRMTRRTEAPLSRP